METKKNLMSFITTFTKESFEKDKISYLVENTLNTEEVSLQDINAITTYSTDSNDSFQTLELRFQTGREICIVHVFIDSSPSSNCFLDKNYKIFSSEMYGSEIEESLIEEPSTLLLALNKINLGEQLNLENQLVENFIREYEIERAQLLFDDIKQFIPNLNRIESIDLENFTLHFNSNFSIDVSASSLEKGIYKSKH